MRSKSEFSLQNNQEEGGGRRRRHSENFLLSDIRQNLAWCLDQGVLQNDMMLGTPLGH